MATASDVEKLEERVKCPICLERFSDPQTFPCLHSFCKKCVDGLAKTTQYLGAAGPVECYRCPECRSFCTVNAVRNNIDLKDISEIAQGLDYLSRV